jgi:DNA-binding NarL/FixJ family response regulator
MEIQEALKIIKALADGVNPETGEVLPVEPIYQNPQNVRALHRAAGALEFLEERERIKRLLPKNAGKPWTTQEEAQVCDELRSGTDFQQIARIHNRTVASIVARLIRLGKVSSKTPPTKVA